jgi:glutathione S-transferase
MATLLYATPSPYSAKVRMALRLAGLETSEQKVDASAEPDILITNNPLGKIPVLIDDEGTSVFNSPVILRHINMLNKNSVFPANAVKRGEAERMEAAADGLCDACIAVMYERRSRPQEIVHQPWIDKQWSKVTRTLDWLEANPPKLPNKLHGGHLAMASALGYLNLRFEGQWERGRPKLKRWLKRFSEKFPEMASVLPAA